MGKFERAVTEVGGLGGDETVLDLAVWNQSLSSAAARFFPESRLAGIITSTGHALGCSGTSIRRDRTCRHPNECYFGPRSS